MLLTAAALATERLRLGPLVTPVARRRPQQLARQVSTLDNLSGGRVIFGAGLGGPIEDEYGSFGEPTDPRLLAELLDEGLDLLGRYWSGEAVTHEGRHFRVEDVTLLPAAGATTAGTGLDRRVLAASPADAARRPMGRRRAVVHVGQARPPSAAGRGPRPGRVSSALIATATRSGRSSSCSAGRARPTPPVPATCSAR